MEPARARLTRQPIAHRANGKARPNRGYSNGVHSNGVGIVIGDAKDIEFGEY